MSQAERIVVVGAGLAGLRAAERLRELGFSGELVMVGSEAQPPYHRPALSKQLLTGAMRPGDLVLPAYQEIGAKWRLGTTARYLSTRNRVLHLPGNEELGYDGLIIATGVEAVRPNNVPYHDSRIMEMRTLPDALKLERAIAANRGPVAVVGGGFTGCEIAASLRHMGREVTLIGRSPSLLGNVLGPKLGDWLTGLHRDHGVDLALATSVTDWQPSSDGIGMYLSDGTSLLAACVVIAAGTTPSTGWLRGSGLPLDNGVVCEPTCHVVGADDVVAAGDVAQWPNIRFDTVPRRIEHWLNAVEMGRAAAESLMAGRVAAEPFTPMPRFWTEQYGVRIQAAGVPKLGTDTITLGTPDDGTGTVMGYVRDGKLMGVVGLDCPSSILTWTETICLQNPSPTDPIPAEPEPVVGGRGGRSGPRHSLPPKPKRTRSKQPTYGRLATMDSSARLRPAESNPGFRPVDSNARMRPAESSARLRPADSNPGFRPADPSARMRPGDSSARLRPAESNPNFRPVDSNGRLRPGESSPGFRPVDANPGFRPVDSNARLRPAESNHGFRPVEPNPRLGPGDSNPRIRPVDSNSRLRPAIPPNPRPAPPTSVPAFPPAPSNTRIPPVRNGFQPSGPLDPSARFGPNASNPRLRPATNGFAHNGHSGPDVHNGHSGPGLRNGHPGPAAPNGHAEPAARNGHSGPAARNGHSGPAPRNGHPGPVDSSSRIPPARNGFPYPGPADSSGRPRQAERNGHPGPLDSNGRTGRAESSTPYRPPTNGFGPATPRNGHSGTLDTSARFGPEEFNAQLPTNGHSGPAQTNGKPTNGHHTNGSTNGHTPSNGQLRPLDIYDRFATGQIPPVQPDVTSWIPRVDARKPQNHSR